MHAVLLLWVVHHVWPGVGAVVNLEFVREVLLC